MEEEIINAHEPVTEEESEGSDLYAMFGTERSKETEGVWIVYGADKDKDPRFKVARAGGDNLKYNQAMVRKIRPYQRVINNQGNAPDSATLKLIEKLTQEAFIETCLLDWANVRQGKKGPLIPFSQESAAALFKKLPDLYRDLAEQSQQLTNFRSEEVEAASKN
jgi:hypothetical protein